MRAESVAEARSPLEGLPKDLFPLIMRDLSLLDLARLAQTSRTFRWHADNFLNLLIENPHFFFWKLAELSPKDLGKFILSHKELTKGCCERIKSQKEPTHEVYALLALITDDINTLDLIKLSASIAHLQERISEFPFLIHIISSLQLIESYKSQKRPEKLIIESGCYINYSGANWSLHYAKADFWCRTDLSYSNFQSANLSGAELEGDNLKGSNLQNANLEDSTLKGACLIDANIEGVRFTPASHARNAPILFSLNSLDTVKKEIAAFLRSGLDFNILCGSLYESVIYKMISSIPFGLSVKGVGSCMGHPEYYTYMKFCRELLNLIYSLGFSFQKFPEFDEEFLFGIKKYIDFQCYGPAGPHVSSDPISQDIDELVYRHIRNVCLDDVVASITSELDRLTMDRASLEDIFHEDMPGRETTLKLELDFHERLAIAYNAFITLRNHPKIQQHCETATLNNLANKIDALRNHIEHFIKFLRPDANSRFFQLYNKSSGEAVKIKKSIPLSLHTSPERLSSRHRQLLKTLIDAFFEEVKINQAGLKRLIERGLEIGFNLELIVSTILPLINERELLEFLLTTPVVATPQNPALAKFINSVGSFFGVKPKTVCQQSIQQRINTLPVDGKGKEEEDAPAP